MKRWAVALCGYYGMGNLGDELLAQACIDRLVDAGISRSAMVMLSGNTQESERIHGIFAVDRWAPKEVWRTLRDSETLLLGGGGLFQDSSSLRSPLYYWGIVRMAWTAGCRPWAFGQSVGPLNSSWARLLTKDALRLCQICGVRDSRSLEVLKRMGCRNGIQSCDLVLGKSFDPLNPSRHPRYLLNLRPWNGDLEFRAAEAFELLPIPEGTLKTGVAMAPEDRALMEYFVKEGRLRLHEIVTAQEQNIPEIFSGVQRAFGMRLHFGILSLASKTPCVMVPYDPKVEGFAAEWGLPLWREGPLEGGLFSAPFRFDALDRARKELDRVFSESLKEVLGEWTWKTSRS